MLYWSAQHGFFSQKIVWCSAYVVTFQQNVAKLLKPLKKNWLKKRDIRFVPSPRFWTVQNGDFLLGADYYGDNKNNECKDNNEKDHNKDNLDKDNHEKSSCYYKFFFGTICYKKISAIFGTLCQVEWYPKWRIFKLSL